LIVGITLFVRYGPIIAWYLLDEEKALVKAIKSSFPNSELTLCTRHLNENMSRHMRNKVGMNEKATKQVVDEIFGDNGLIEADTTVQFNGFTTIVFPLQKNS
jgi:hypothetical protein